MSRKESESLMLAMQNARWKLGDTVAKKRGSSWRGYVVGYYATAATKIGYAVESFYEPGSVQVWPEAALDDWNPIEKRYAGYTLDEMKAWKMMPSNTALIVHALIAEIEGKQEWPHPDGFGGGIMGDK